MAILVNQNNNIIEITQDSTRVVHIVSPGARGSSVGITSGSFSGSFQGDGSGLTGIGGGSSKWTGSSDISRLGNVSITGSLTISGSSTLKNIGPAQFTGSLIVTEGITGSLEGTSSWATNSSQSINSSIAISSSISQTSSFARSGNGIFSGSFSGSFVGDGSQLIGITSSKWTGSSDISRLGNVLVTGSLEVLYPYDNSYSNIGVSSSILLSNNINQKESIYNLGLNIQIGLSSSIEIEPYPIIFNVSNNISGGVKVDLYSYYYYDYGGGLIEYDPLNLIETIDINGDGIYSGSYLFNEAVGWYGYYGLIIVTPNSSLSASYIGIDNTQIYPELPTSRSLNNNGILDGILLSSSYQVIQNSLSSNVYYTLTNNNHYIKGDLTSSNNIKILGNLSSSGFFSTGSNILLGTNFLNGETSISGSANVFINDNNFIISSGAFNDVSSISRAFRFNNNRGITISAKSLSSPWGQQRLNVGLDDNGLYEGFSIIGSGSILSINISSINQWRINLGSDAPGDMYFRTGGSPQLFSRLPIGTSGQVLTVSGGLPVWQIPGSGSYVVSLPITAQSTGTLFNIINARLGPDVSNSNLISFNNQSIHSSSFGLTDIIIGTNNLQSSSQSWGNIVLGQNNLPNISASSEILGGRNIALGYGNGNNIRNGTHNIIIGDRNGSVASGSNFSYSVNIGYETNLSSSITGSRHDSHIAIGNYTMRDFRAISSSQGNGQGNIAIGNYAMDGYIALGSSGKSIALGELAFQYSTAEWYNIGIGWRAGQSASLGRGNILIGPRAGRNMVGGTEGDSGVGTNQFNIAIGTHTLENGSGEKSTFIGTEAGSSIVRGRANTGLGNWSLNSVSGSYNTGLGAFAGYNSVVLTGSYNTFIGFNTSYNTSSLNNTVVIGVGVTASLSNKIYLGNATQSVILGSVPNNNTDTKILSIGEDGQINYITSSILYSGSYSGSFNGSLIGTSSWAINSSQSISSSYAVSSSIANFTISSSYATSSANAISASYIALAQSASNANNAQSASVAISSSISQTSSFARSGNGIFSGSFSGSLTGSLFGTSSWATNSSQSISSSVAISSSLANFAISSSYATSSANSITSSLSLFAISSSYATSSATSLTASYIDLARSASNAVNAQSSSIAISSSISQTSSFARSGNGIFSGSFSGSYIGDGSGLTGIGGGSSKWTGSSDISRLGNVSVTGSLNVSSSGAGFNTIGTSLFIGPITASIISASSGITGSLFGTSSWSINSSQSISSSWSVFSISSSYATSSANALTASFVALANSSSNAINAQSASVAISSSISQTSSFARSGNGIFSGSFSGSFQGDGSGLTGIIASANPAGPNQSIQFNDNGSTSGSGNFKFNKSLNLVTVTGSFIISGSTQVNILGASQFTGPITASIISASSNITASGLYVTGTLEYNILGATQFIGPITASIISGSAVTGSLLGTASYSLRSPYRFEMGAMSGDGSTLTTGAKGIKSIDFNGRMIEWVLIASASSDVSASIWRLNKQIPTTANSIFTASLNSSTLTSGTLDIAVSEGDIFRFEIKSNTAASYVFMEMKII